MRGKSSESSMLASFLSSSHHIMAWHALARLSHGQCSVTMAVCTSPSCQTHSFISPREVSPLNKTNVRLLPVLPFTLLSHQTLLSHPSFLCSKLPSLRHRLTLCTHMGDTNSPIPRQPIDETVLHQTRKLDATFEAFRGQSLTHRYRY